MHQGIDLGSACVILITIAAACMTTLPAHGASAEEAVKVVQHPATSSKNNHYASNRSPLIPNPLIKLPVGSIRPEGWLRTQLELEAEGFSGRLTEISPWCNYESNAWVDVNTSKPGGWEEMPYWLKGYADLGYILQDQRIISEAQKWIDAILASQRPDGYFGPKENWEKRDLWPNMIALYALRSHYEATGDKRVLPFMTKYFKWQMTIPLEDFLPGSWQKVRGGDSLDSIYWLYNRTGDDWLLDLGRLTHERTIDWSGTIANWHGVNFCQGFREPAQYYQQAKDPRYLNATERNYDKMMDLYGQVPGGMFGADENAREGYTGPRQAAETCSMTEIMYSHEMLTCITGDPVWADRCEDVAFNSLPASMTPDLKGLHYLTAPNMIQLDGESKSPMIQNGGDMLSFNPHSYRCCQHNAAFGWPYYAEHLWMATQDNGLAAVLYAASSVKAKVGDGTTVQFTETTDYPFDEKITFKLSTPKSVKFPFLMRIPGWCSEPKVSINGKPVTIPADASGWIVINRTWEDGDTVYLELPMSIEVKVWEKNKNSVSVYRGPLAYSLKIGERWEKYGGTDNWPAFEVFPTTPWNYGLIIDQADPAASFDVIKWRKKLADQPFTPENAPVTIIAKGKRIPEWKQEDNGLVGEIIQSPVKSDELVEEITLIPMGCARLRISAFPRIDN